MDLNLKQTFLTKWKTYFNSSELPLVFYYTDQKGRAEMVPAAKGHRCLIGALKKARTGTALCFESESIGCGGGKRYLGFTREIAPNFEYFLSCGIEGKMPGERYKKTPEMVKALMEKIPFFDAPAKYIVFKRWDLLDQEDNPAVAIFFATADVLSGLFTLAGFEEIEEDTVIAPFAAGCGSIVMYPFLESQRQRQRTVIGMFDVSARPYVEHNELTLAVPLEKMTRMISDMDNSFLITPSWDKVRRRIAS